MRSVELCVYLTASNFYGTLYIGVTSNLLGRIIQHRDGTFDGFTKEYRGKRLVWYEAGTAMEAVIVTEKRMKRWRRDRKIAPIERDHPAWAALAVGLGLPPLP